MRLRSASGNRPRDEGITLLELAIAILVLAMGSIAAIRATDQSRVAIGGAKDRMLAQVVARNRAEELRLNDAGAVLGDTVVLGGRTFMISTETLPTAGGLVQVAILAQAPGGAGARIVVYLSGGAP